jgi:ribosomal protein S18 acetylase RimI-like enzyme
MSIRQIRLPDDLSPIVEIAAETWDYPDHPEWNVQPDEEESLADSMDNYKRVWPFIRLIQFLSPGLRDFLHGHVWEEEGRIAGFTQIHRRGTTDTWYISAVGVHPDFRRRGIAQQLVESAIELVHQRNGKRLLLDVIEENVPAVNLYEKLGFEHYASNYQMETRLQSTPLEVDLPEGYQLEVTDDFAWQPRYELMKRITPEQLARSEPVEEGRYKKPLLTRLLLPILKWAEGLEVDRFTVTRTDGPMVAYATCDTRTRDTGRNSIMVELDPDCPEVASYLINHLLKRVFEASPEKAIEFTVPDWQYALLGSAKGIGFEVRAKLLTLGLLLNA